MVAGQEEILRTCLAIDHEPAFLRPADLLHGLGRRDVNEQDRHPDDFAKCDGAVCGLPFHRLGRHLRVVFQGCGTPGLHSCRQVMDAVVVLGVNHDHGAVRLRRFQRPQDLPVIESHAVIGHVDLVGRVAVLDERRNLLAEQLIVGIDEDDVERIVDDSAPFGLGMVLLNR